MPKATGKNLPKLIVLHCYSTAAMFVTQYTLSRPSAPTVTSWLCHKKAMKIEHFLAAWELILYSSDAAGSLASGKALSTPFRGSVEASPWKSKANIPPLDAECLHSQSQMLVDYKWHAQQKGCLA